MACCPTCQKALPDGSGVCSRCGAVVAGAPVVVTVALTPEAGPLAGNGPPLTPPPDRILSPMPAPATAPATAPASSVTAAGSVAEIVLTPPPPPAAPTLVVKLRVIRGLRMNAEFPVYPGRNVLGRFADRPVDIDLTGVEPEGQVWSSRRHAALTLDKALLVVEDLNSLNGTWVNGARLRAGSALPLKSGDVIQIGVAQLRVEIESA